MFNKIKLMERINHPQDLRYGIWNGTVVDTKDPLQVGRIKVSIPELSEGIPIEKLPWYVGIHEIQGTPNSQAHVPTMGSQVLVEFPQDDFYNGIYRGVIISKPPIKDSKAK